MTSPGLATPRCISRCAVSGRPWYLVARGASAAGARMVAISTESRDLAADEIRRAMFAASAEFPVDCAARVFKKIDSTLRGNTGVEIAAAMEAFDCDAAVVCPAFPKQNRVVEGGQSEGDERAGIWSHRCGRAACRFRPGLRARMFVRRALRRMLSEGMRLVSVEASCDLDLDCIAAAILPMGRRVLWAGSAGLASALARAIGGACAPPAVPARSGAALFCIGSDHGVTLAQQAALLEERRAVLFSSRRGYAGIYWRRAGKRQARGPADSARAGLDGAGARTDRRSACGRAGTFGRRYGVAGLPGGRSAAHRAV